jgi:hypothetical protein
MVGGWIKRFIPILLEKPELNIIKLSLLSLQHLMEIKSTLINTGLTI